MIEQSSLLSAPSALSAIPGKAAGQATADTDENGLRFDDHVNQNAARKHADADNANGANADPDEDTNLDAGVNAKPAASTGKGHDGKAASSRIDVSTNFDPKQTSHQPVVETSLQDQATNAADNSSVGSEFSTGGVETLADDAAKSAIASLQKFSSITAKSVTAEPAKATSEPGKGAADKAKTDVSSKAVDANDDDLSATDALMSLLGIDESSKDVEEPTKTESPKSKAARHDDAETDVASSPATTATAANGAALGVTLEAAKTTSDGKVAQTEQSDAVREALAKVTSVTDAPDDVPDAVVDNATAKATGAGGQAAANFDLVTVLDSRRYLGFGGSENASALTNAISKEAAATLSSSSAQIVSGDRHTTTTVSTLKIQMNPEHLGSMTASLRLKGEELSVDVVVDTIEGYRHLAKDQSSIVQSLRDQGLNVDQVSIQLNPSAKSDSQMQDSGQGGNDRAMSNGQSEGGRQRNDTRQSLTGELVSTDGALSTENTTTPGSADGASGGLYL